MFSGANISLVVIKPSFKNREIVHCWLITNLEYDNIHDMCKNQSCCFPVTKLCKKKLRSRIKWSSSVIYIMGTEEQHSPCVRCRSVARNWGEGYKPISSTSLVFYFRLWKRWKAQLISAGFELSISSVLSYAFCPMQ